MAQQDTTSRSPSVTVAWYEELSTGEARELDVDTNRWREIFGRPFDPDTVEPDDFETYMSNTGQEAKSLNYTVYDRTLENFIVTPSR